MNCMHRYKIGIAIEPSHKRLRTTGNKTIQIPGGYKPKITQCYKCMYCGHSKFIGR